MIPSTFGLNDNLLFSFREVKSEAKTSTRDEKGGKKVKVNALKEK